MVRSFLIPSVFLLATMTTKAAAQDAAEAGTLRVTAKIGSKAYEEAGAGSCKHEPKAYIYGAPAALWMVEYSGADKAKLQGANVTLWRPKDGGEQLSMALRTGSSSHRINVGGRGEQVGSGKAALALDGPGGRFEIKGKDADGTPIDLVITCPAFAAIEAEGG